MVEPIGPDEVDELHASMIPDVVFEAFNELIVENWSPTSRYSEFTQDAVMNRILDKFGLEKDSRARSNKRSELYKRRHLDVEPLYRAKGWSVTYDKPAYNEDYPASFKFVKPR